MFFVRYVYLYRYVIDEYCIARRAVLVGSFIDALTRGGPNGHPKPMEHHAHDPQRYVGDMLAWLIQNIPVEKENLFILVKLCDKTGRYAKLCLKSLFKSMNYTYYFRQMLFFHLKQIISSYPFYFN